MKHYGLAMKKSALLALVLGVLALAGVAMSGAGELPKVPLPGQDLLSYRFLWPADVARPGEGLIELRPEVRESGATVETPLGPARAATIDLLDASGRTVAVTKIITLEGRDDVRIFETEIKVEIPAPTGTYEVPHFGLPALAAPKDYSRVLTYKCEEFVTPVHREFPSSGPVLLFSDDLEVVVFSPLDNFMDAMTAPGRGEWSMGFGGMIRKVPAGTVHQVIVVSGQGVNDTFVKWGKLVQAWHGHQPADPYADVAMSNLGYWTDNGSYYYYRTEPGKNYEDTLLAVKAYADAEGIPYGYLQIDSWWYPKAEINLQSSRNRGGFLKWEPIPEMFPDGLAAFTEKLGLPLVAHNRYPADVSPYCDQYDCAMGTDEKRRGALPKDPAFWDEIMDNARAWNIEVYEQDWLYTHMPMIPWLREDLGNAASWYDGMAGAAEKRGITMQLCMASPEHFMQAIKHPNETHARTSHDYKGGLAKSFFWVPFHEASLFAHAVGLWPFKDNFQTTKGQRATYMIVPENNPEDEALVAALSGGPVGPSDRIGFSNRDLIMKTCRQDGVLLKPDRPATPIDRMFLGNDNMVVGGVKPWIVHTWSDHQIGRSLYLAAFNLWAWRMIDPSITLDEVGLSGKYVAYEFEQKTAKVVDRKLSFGLMAPEAGPYFILAPLQGNGMAVIGETGKFITLSKKRFPEIALDGDAVTLAIDGVPGEEIEVSVYADQPPKSLSGASWTQGPREGLNVLKVVIPESGSGGVEIR